MARTPRAAQVSRARSRRSCATPAPMSSQTATTCGTSGNSSRTSPHSISARPITLPAGNPGRGWLIAKGVLVVNGIGRTFMAPADDPFRAMDDLLTELGDRAPRVRILDWHAEATSEKRAMGWHLDGRFSAVVGSHTHVPTADPRVLPQGTALVTDTGMVGPRDSVLGIDPAIIVSRFRTGMPHRFEVARGPVQFNSVLIDVDPESGRATGIQRVDQEWDG